MIKRLLSFIMALCLLTSFCTAFAAESPEFTDVTRENWAYESIKKFSGMGVINGFSDGSFQPDGNVTREQFAKMLALTFDIKTTGNPVSAFTDVPSNSWSCGYIESCKAYLPGDGSVYNPSIPAAREDIIAALALAVGLESGDTANAEKAFTDFSEVKPGLAGLISAAVENGLANGYENSTLRPKGSMTRAEAVTMLDRALSKKQSAEPEKPAESEISAPELKITACPETTDTNEVTVMGVVTVKGEGAPSLKVNGTKTDIGKNGSFSAVVKLKEGKNEIIFIAENSGKKTEVTKTVTYEKKGNENQPTGENKFWALLTGDSFRTKTQDGRNAMEMNIWDGENNLTVQILTDEDLSSKVTKGVAEYFTQNPDGSVAMERWPGKFGAITGVAEKEIIIASGNSSDVYEITSDTVILYTDASGNGASGSGFDYKAALDDDGLYRNNVYFVQNNSNKLKCIVINVDGKWD